MVSSVISDPKHAFWVSKLNLDFNSCKLTSSWFSYNQLWPMHACPSPSSKYNQLINKKLKGKSKAYQTCEFKSSRRLEASFFWFSSCFSIVESVSISFWIFWTSLCFNRNDVSSVVTSASYLTFSLIDRNWKISNHRRKSHERTIAVAWSLQWEYPIPYFP